jgi:hypothetical protein
MKTSGYLVLYISENDDFELWRALCQIPPEKRAATVKAALQNWLLQEEAGIRAEKKAAYTKLPESYVNQSPVGELALEELGLDLAPESLDFDLSAMEESLPISTARDKSPLPGLDFLLNNVIGEEDDEEVIEYFKKTRAVKEDDL